MAQEFVEPDLHFESVIAAALVDVEIGGFDERDGLVGGFG